MQPELPLRDIHIPEAISWWPPAIGWWIVLIVGIASFIALFLLIKHRLRPTPVKSAKKLLQAIAEDTDSSDFAKLQKISALLRRVAMSNAPRQQAASLHGRAWLQYLDQSMPEQPFSHGAGQCLGSMHFRKENQVSVDMQALLHLCERWLKEQKS